MLTGSPVPSISHPGYEHPPGTEAALEPAPDGGGYRLMTLTVRKEDGEVDWTEQFLLPIGMKYDPKQPKIIEPAKAGQASFVVENGLVTGVRLAVPDPTADGGVRYQVFPIESMQAAIKPPNNTGT